MKKLLFALGLLLSGVIGFVAGPLLWYAIVSQVQTALCSAASVGQNGSCSSSLLHWRCQD